MFILLKRQPSQADYMRGELFIDGIKQCETLEDERREIKVKAETAIPDGQYEIKLRTEGGLHGKYSQKYPFHKGMLWLQNVPNFEYIYIHTGNTDDHTEGCILVGMVKTQDGIGRSVEAYTNIYPQIADAIGRGEKVMIEVR
jgi:hypothetical protein